MLKIPAALVALLLLPVPVASAAPACDVRRAELVGATAARIVVGQQHVQGYVLRQRLGGGQSCVIAGAAVELLARTANTADTRVVRTGTTDANGRVEWAVRPLYTTVLQARLADQSLQSAPATLSTATRISVSAARLGPRDCRARATGRTFPAKPGSSVVVYGQDRETRRAIVASDGTYATVVPVACDGSTQLLAYIGPTYRNAHGWSDEPRPVAATAPTCSTFVAGEGPAQSGLTLALELFNTTARPGGFWAGEVVVANPTSQPLSYRAEDSFRVGEPYRVLRAGSTDVVSTENSTDAGAPPETTTLQPGEEKRVRVSVAATTCPRPHVFGSGHGDALPVGTYEAAAVKHVDGGRTWSSARVAVRVAD